MAPFRNFLTRKSAAPNSGEIDSNDADSRLSAESHHSNGVNIRKSDENEPPEYKLSVVDGNGAYLPPSPPEKQSFWKKYPGSNRSSSNHRNLVDENEPFSISRESFDSYRRSFDISARSPVGYTDAMHSRTSFDSRFSRVTSSPSATNGFSKPESMEEELFEDVGLDDEEVKPKKKGIFSRFTDSSSGNQTPVSSKSTSSHLGFHIPGRKRGQSGVGAELGAIQQPPPSTEAESA